MKKVLNLPKGIKEPYGYIYKATNKVDGKVYIGKTKTARWNNNQNPIQGRWDEEVEKALSIKNQREAHPDKKIQARYVENAIAKYGPDNFELEQIDKAYSLKELNEKETHWIKEYDSMNPDKGYNMREGGEGGELNQDAKDRISKALKEFHQQNPEAAKERGQKLKEFHQQNPEAAKEKYSASFFEIF